ncbi:MAG: hypothetical protein ACRDYC_02450 [Acidimicrobiales bacterium]
MIGDDMTRKLAAETVLNQAEDLPVRAAAVTALGALSFGLPEDRDTLIAAKNSGEASLAEAASDALIGLDERTRGTGP